MELTYSPEKNLQQRIDFIIQYSKWVKEVPNKVWSRQHADFINNMMKNSQNCNITADTYLKIKLKARKN
jgi:phenolic acid decarboxylase